MKQAHRRPHRVALSMRCPPILGRRDTTVFSGMFEPQRRPRPKFTDKDKLPLYEYQKGKCNGCQEKFKIQNMAVDRIKAFAKGGSDKTRNTQLLCTSCNSIKGDGTMAQLKKRLEAKGYIKPATKASTARKSAAAKKPATKAKPVAKRKPARKK